jgi:flagellin
MAPCGMKPKNHSRTETTIMSLNVVSNYSANVAHRNLASTEGEMSSSLVKLSAGTRVLSSKDDAASMAIGSHIKAEVSALKQASTNAGQASSMLQIADGAMGTVGDVLIRMKTLAVQGASDNLSSTERSMLDTEFQSLLSEIDRVANDTEFNGTKLVQGSTEVTASTNSLAGDDNNIEAADGVSNISFDSDVTDAAFSLEFDATSNVLTMTNLTDGTSQGVDIGATAIAQNATQEVRFENMGASITLNNAFDKATDLSTTGGAVSATAGNGGIEAGSFEITSATGGAGTALSTNAGTVDGTSASAAVITISGFSGAADLTTTGAKSVTLTNGTDSFDLEFNVTIALSDGDDFDISANGIGAFANSETSTDSSFTYKVGTGTTASEDDLTFTVDSITQTALGINGTALTGTDTSNSDTALTAINSAIDTLNT